MRDGMDLGLKFKPLILEFMLLKSTSCKCKVSTSGTYLKAEQVVFIFAFTAPRSEPGAELASTIISDS